MAQLPSAPAIVLIVDDHADSLAMYECCLAALGFRPITAQSAEHALVRARTDRPDVVVADFFLPGQSGLELVRQLRMDDSTRDARIILLTGHIGAALEQQARDAGCDRFLTKPCLPDALAGEIERLLLEVQDAGGPGH